MKTLFALTLILAVFPLTVTPAFCQDTPTRQGRQLETSQGNPETMLLIRHAGLERDRSQVERLLQIVHEDKASPHVITACWALGRIGDSRALSVYNNINFWKSGINVRGLLALDKARMLYEQAANGEKSTTVEEARTRLNIFLDALGFTLPELKKRFEHDVEQEGGPLIMSKMAHRNVYLGRELADIIFTYGDEHLKRILEEGGIDFSKDFLSEFKIKLAFLSPSERLERLMAELSKNVLRMDERLVFNRLLLDLGEPAQQAVTQKLRDISLHRSDYKEEVVKNFLQVYASFPTGRNRALMQSFLNDANEKVAERAKYLDDEILAQDKVLFEFMDTRY